MSTDIFEGRQIRAARALANVSVEELAEAAGVSARTIGRFEGEEAAIPISPKRRHGHAAKATYDKVVAALRQHGVELLSEGNGHGAGARWVLPRDRRGGQ